jgi:hypothetical protein
MNLVKTKENGRVIYRFRDNTGKHLLYVGDINRLYQLVKSGLEYEEVSKEVLV